ncbi:MAG: C10 family peptidase [Spirochaetaceae bacterium]|nr:C10 family peptidase [Spirochaetaceae bacterium]
MKLKNVFVLFLSVFAIISFSCEDLTKSLNHYTNNGGGGGNSWPSPKLPDVLTEDEFLAVLHLDENPVRAPDEVTEIVNDFISVVVVRNTGTGNVPVITDMETFDVSIDNGFVVRDMDSGEETIPGPSVLPFYRYNVVHPATGTEGAIIASGDKRIGTIIAYIEHETDDAVVTPFMQTLMANLEDYVNMTIDRYNSIPADDIESAVQKSGSIASSQNQTEQAVQVNKDILYITTTGFHPLTRNTEWNQDYGYWEIVNAARGTHQHYVGCVAVAMGQLMAFHKWPGVCSLEGGGFTNPFNSDEAVNFHLFGYNWQAMTAGKDASGLSPAGKLGINILLYEAGVKVNMQYGTDKSSAYMSNIPAALAGMAYDVSESAVRPYNIDTIVTSINKQQPVIIGAQALQITETYTWTTIEHFWLDIFHWFDEEVTHTGTRTRYEGGHAWVIDDYEIVYNEEPGYNSTESYYWTDYFVHCNLGWGGWKDGWYRSGLFDTNREIIDNTMKNIVPGLQCTVVQGEHSYFRYKMEIIPFLKPDYD